MTSGPPVDRGAELGEGLFETLLLVNGHSELLALHAERMRSSAASLAMPCPADLLTRFRRGARRAWRRAGSPRRAALRVRLTLRGPPGLTVVSSLEPRLSFRASEVRARGLGRPSAPVRAVIVGCHRIDPESALAGHKTLSWMPFVLARREARAGGADVALIRTVHGDVAEADFANLFAVLEGRVVTPALTRGVLPGVTRSRALAAFRADGRPVRERRLRPADLGSADEVFLTSSLAGVTPLSSIDLSSIDLPSIDLPSIRLSSISSSSHAAPGSQATWLAACLEGSEGPRIVSGSPA